jgi:hypothetical protein
LILRRICGPKRDEIMGGWRRLHNEDLHNLHSSPNKIRIIVKAYEMGRILVGKSEGKRAVGSPRCRREDNIQTDLRLDWIHVAQNC